MSPDWIARGLAAASFVVALVGLIWSIISWTRSGPHLRVQVLAYREALEIRISNAGRTPNTVANVVMNGRPDSDRVIALAENLELPWSLDPGQTKTVIIERTEPSLRPWWRFVRGGWSDLWVLAGSMHQHHVAIVPVNAKRPPSKGWRFPPRGSTLRRSIPLAVGAPLIALAASAGSSIEARGAVALVAFAVVYRAGLTARTQSFMRRRVERWMLALAVALAVMELVLSKGRTPWSPIPPWENYVAAAYALVAWTIARAGGPTMIRHSLSEIGDRLGIVRARLRRASTRSK